MNFFIWYLLLIIFLLYSLLLFLSFSLSLFCFKLFQKANNSSITIVSPAHQQASRPFKQIQASNQSYVNTWSNNKYKSNQSSKHNYRLLKHYFIFVSSSFSSLFLSVYYICRSRSPNLQKVHPLENWYCSAIHTLGKV